MTIYYLMVKTHRITGLKYLCQTKQSDPYKYTGSGKYWKNHLKVHGKHIDTEILRECITKQELSEWGRHYSELWNIVESSEWANLKPETGQGGNIQTPDSIAKGLQTRLKRRGTLRTTGQDVGEKIMKTKLERYGTLNFNTLESIEKSRETRLERYGAYMTDDMISSMLGTRLEKYGTLSTNTPESIEKANNTKLERYGVIVPHSPEISAKAIETKLAKYGTLNFSTPESTAKDTKTKIEKYGVANISTPESQEKGRQTTLAKYGTLNMNIRVCCIHCRKDITTSTLKQYHGDNCKLKPKPE
jgi:uncharacterized membrane protein